MKKKRGVYDLIEYQLKEKPPVYFENDFGVIRDGKITFYPPNLTLDLTEIAFIDLKVATKRNKIALSLAGLLFLASFYFTSGHLHVLPVLFSSLIFFVCYNFHKRKIYFIQIVLCKIERKVIPITAGQADEAKILIRKYDRYRNLNPEIV